MKTVPATLRIYTDSVWLEPLISEGPAGPSVPFYELFRSDSHVAWIEVGDNRQLVRAVIDNKTAKRDFDLGCLGRWGRQVVISRVKFFNRKRPPIGRSTQGAAADLKELEIVDRAFALGPTGKSVGAVTVGG